MPVKQGTFGAIQSRLSSHIAATRKSASIPTEQGTTEQSNVSLPSSDPEVKDMLPGGGNTQGAPPSDLTGGGVATGEKMPGATEPPKEEKERKEVSPETKLAGVSPEIAELQNRLGGNLKLAADLLAAELNPQAKQEPKVEGPKTAEATSLGEKETAPDNSLGNDVKNDDTSTPVIKNAPVTGVTQTEVKPATEPSTTQGPAEKSPDSKLAGIDMDELAKKVASCMQDVEAGRKMAHNVVGLLGDIAHPDYQDREKLAAAVQEHSIPATANALMDLGVQSGIISQKQAEDLMKAAGFEENPVVTAIKNLNLKVAAVAQSSLSDEQKLAFMNKVAEMGADPNAGAAAAEAAGGQPPVDPSELHGAIGELINQLMQAVQSGQISEEQAMEILKQQGIPVDELLAQAGGGDPAAGAGDPAAAGGDPAASLGATIGADDPAAGAPAAPAAPAAPEAPAIGGDPAVIAPPTPTPDSAPAGDSAPAEKKEEKSEGKSEEKKEEKSDDKKDEKKEEKKDDDKPDDKAKEAALKKATLGFKVAAFLGGKAAGAQTEKTAGVPTLLDPNSATPVGPADPLQGIRNYDPLKAVQEHSPKPPLVTAGAPEAPAAAPAAAAAGGAAPVATSPEGMSTLQKWMLGGGIGLAGLAAYNMLHKNPEEERRRRHLKGAEAPIDGGDPLSAGTQMETPPGAGGEGNTLQDLIQDLQEAVQQGLIPQEEAQQILAMLSGGAGDAGGAPPPDAGAAGANAIPDSASPPAVSPAA